MTATLPALSEERKTEILDVLPDGIWIVLGEEFPPDFPLAIDPFAGQPTFTSEEDIQATSLARVPR